MMMRQRGQATVELALSSLVFVSILIFGIHFAEVGVIKLRVQQAAHSALFDTTAMRHHKYNGGLPDFDRPTQARDSDNRSPAGRAEDHYKDFDGMDDQGSGTNFTQVFSRGSNLNVTCDPAAVGVFTDLGDPEFDGIQRAFRHPSAAGGDVDGMACNAAARVGAWRIPRNFAEKSQGSFFNQEHVPDNAIKVCAFGRAGGGNCSGAVMMAYDDWGLAGHNAGNELEECNAACSQNPVDHPYKKTVQRVYAHYRNTGEDPVIQDAIVNLFAAAPLVHIPEMSNLIPTKERDFRFVFAGEEQPGGRKRFSIQTREMTLTDSDTPGAQNFYWAVTPYGGKYETAYDRRGRCFLGSECDKPVFAKDQWP